MEGAFISSWLGQVVGFLIFDLWVVWAPLLLFFMAEYFWHHYVAERFIAGIQWDLIEIKVPRDMKKSPLAMELFITNALYQKTSKGLMEIYVQGAVWFWFSLEIASIDGQVHYFIRIPSRLRNLVESQLYAHFPQVELTKVEDYTRKIPTLVKDGPYNAWGCEWVLEKEDPYPIKTYVDFGLDKDPKDEFRNDPITGVLEYLGSIKKGEQLWIQIIVRASFKSWHTHGTLFKHHGYYDEMMRLLKEMLEPYTKVSRDDHGNVLSKEPRTPDYLKTEIEAIKRAANKLPFDVGIRTMYVATKEAWDNNTRRGFRTMFRQYGSPNTNSFKRIRSTQYDYPWQNPYDIPLFKLKNRMLMYYKLRTLFYPPFWLSFEYPVWSYIFPSQKPEYFILNTEELATIWHFPSRGTETPTIERIETRTSKPPANLPF